jgi:hypothetical protein
LEIRDVAFDPDGRTEILESCGGPYSVAAWLELPLTELEVPAGGERRLRGSLRVPRDAVQAGGTAALLFTARTTSESEEERHSELAALVIAAVPQLAEPEAALDNMAVVFDPSRQETQLRFAFHNTGNLFLYPSSGSVALNRVLEPETRMLEGGIEVVSAGGTRTEPVADLSFESLAAYVLPETTRTFVAVYEGELAPGEYQVEAEITYGGDLPALLTQHFVVEPGTQVPAVAEGTAQEESSP